MCCGVQKNYSKIIETSFNTTVHRCQYKISYQISQYTVQYRLEQLQNERNKENFQNIML